MVAAGVAGRLQLALQSWGLQEEPLEGRRLHLERVKYEMPIYQVEVFSRQLACKSGVQVRDLSQKYKIGTHQGKDGI